MSATQPSEESQREPAELPSSVGAPEASSLFVWFFLLLLLFSIYLFYRVMAPFLHSFILASVFSALCYPFFQRCILWTKGRKTLAAMLVLLVLTVVVAIPVTFFIIGLIPQASRSISAVNQWLTGQHLGELITNHIDPVLAWLNTHFPEQDFSTLDLRNSVLSMSRSIGQWLLSSGTFLLGNMLLMSMYFLLVLGIMFYLLMNGVELLKRIEYLCPLKPRQTAVVIESMRRISRAVFVGGLLVATLQGIAGGIGLSIVGIPALFWGTVMAFAALVPVVGTGLVWVPAVLGLFLMGETGKALFLLIWCAGGVSSIDTFLRPFLLRDGSSMPVLFLFLSILGGVQAFGMLGLLYGPMILGLAAVMLSIYSEEYHDVLSTRTRN